MRKAYLKILEDEANKQISFHTLYAQFIRYIFESYSEPAAFNFKLLFGSIYWHFLQSH
jgi:hypothetical protein